MRSLSRYLNVMLLPKEKLVCKHRELMAVQLHPLLLDEHRDFGFVGSIAEVTMLLTLHLTRGHVQAHHAHVAGHVDVLLCVCARARCASVSICVRERQLSACA
jgi:hypothetical protein